MIPYGAPIVSAPPHSGILGEWQLAPQSYYLVVCRLEPENHVLEVLDGFTTSASTRWLVVVGDLSDSEYVTQLRQRSDPRIRFVGTVYEAAKLQALRYHAFAYCHGHSVGGTNPSLLESLGCGSAVLAHENRYNKEVARDAALYFSSGAVFSACVRALEADEALRQRMKASAQRIVATDYTWEGVAERYFQLLSARSVDMVEGART